MQGSLNFLCPAPLHVLTFSKFQEHWVNNCKQSCSCFPNLVGFGRTVEEERSEMVFPYFMHSIPVSSSTSVPWIFPKASVAGTSWTLQCGKHFWEMLFISTSWLKNLKWWYCKTEFILMVSVFCFVFFSSALP